MRSHVRFSLLSSSEQSGFSLIELMIATVIGLLLTAAMLSAYVASARTYQLQEAMSEVQESGRFAIHALLKDLRQSGVGVSGSSIIEGISNTAVGVAVFEADHSDLIISQKNVRSDIVYLPGLKADKTDVGDPDGVAFYIGSTGVGRIALYRNKDSLVEGVSALVMEYGIDSDADTLVDSYKKLADMNTADWGGVISARFYLLMSSSGTGGVGRAQQLAAPFAAVDTSDRRLYQVYMATALLRNALIVKDGG